MDFEKIAQMGAEKRRKKAQAQKTLSKLVNQRLKENRAMKLRGNPKIKKNMTLYRSITSKKNLLSTKQLLAINLFNQKFVTIRFQHISIAEEPSISKSTSNYNFNNERCFNNLDLKFENSKEAFKVGVTAEKLAKYGIKSILDYSVETDISLEKIEESINNGISDDEKLHDKKSITFMHPNDINCKNNNKNHPENWKDYAEELSGSSKNITTQQMSADVKIFCKSIDAAEEATKSQGFIALKLTALACPQLLLKLSERLIETQNFLKDITGYSLEEIIRMDRIKQKQIFKDIGLKSDFLKDWLKIVDYDLDGGQVYFYDWKHLLKDNPELTNCLQSLNIKTERLEPLIFNLNDEDKDECMKLVKRLLKIGDYAASKGVRILIDAEHSYFQPAISRLTLALMKRYNKKGNKILNTYQAYLKNALNSLKIDMYLANREHFYFGCKLVRGAYMDLEREQANAIGYEDPINPNYEATTEMYENCLEQIANEHNARGKEDVSVMVASHNEETVRYAVTLMNERNISPQEGVICFAQLYGMCDQVSFSLGQAGYSIYKYLPYGPVEEVLPYLSRRALENSGMLKTMNKERNMLWQELKRRLLSGKFIYSPKINYLPSSNTSNV